MKTVRPIILASLLALSATAANASTYCQRIGDQTFCSGDNLSGSQRIGNSTYYNYADPGRAQRDGLPSSSQRIGNTRYYDNGVTRQSIGNTDYFSNGVTKQRIGNTDYYSNGRTCQTIGSTRYCN